MILLIDNYDSFTYNLVQVIGTINPDIKVIRNDAMSVEEIEKLKPSHIILSPGPGYPKDAGVCEEVVRKLQGKIPILGVCLGHQAICEVYGAKITHARKLMHGKKSRVKIETESPIFAGMEEEIDAARYHSLIANEDTIPGCLQVLSTDENGEIMAVGHKEYPVYGLQFHPESILTPKGKTILENFLNIKAGKGDRLMIKEAIHTLMNGQDLSYDMAREVMEEMMDGTATQAQMGSFLTALRMRGETIDEITAFAQVMREKGVKIKPEREVIDIVGTGGDEVGTFNISTTSAFVVAAGGVPVAKHGNRSVSSKSGAADVLENLGANVALDAKQNETILNQTGMCFMFAPVYHSHNFKLSTYFARYYDEYKGLYEIHQYMMAQHFRQLPRLWVRQVRGDCAYIRQQPIGKKTKIKWAIYSAFRNFDRFVGGTLGGKYHTYSEAKQKFLDKHISQQYRQRKA